MENPLETVRVRRWNLLEHVADYVRNSDSLTRALSPTALIDFGQIQDQAGGMRLCFEKSANQTPVPPAYVADCLNTREVEVPQRVQNQAAMSD